MAEAATSSHTFGTTMNRIALAFLATAPLLISSCGLGFYDFDVLTAEKTEKGVEFVPDTMICEESRSICFEVRKRTWRHVRQCILHDCPKHGYTAYAFTGAGSGRVFTLRTGGIDTFRVVKDDAWTTSPRDYVCRAIGEEPNQAMEGTAR